jgi:hypothetical protein
MSKSEIATYLRSLGKGIHPETGEVLPADCLVQDANYIRMLFSLAEQLDELEKGRKRKGREQKTPPLSPEERRANNLKEGRQPRAGFAWSQEEVQAMIQQYRQTSDLKLTAVQSERSEYACALKLVDAGLMTEQQIEELGLRKTESLVKKAA